MLSFAYKRFDGKVPEPGELHAEDRELLAKVEAGFETVGELYNACKFRAAPLVPSGQAWARRWRWPARPTVTPARARCGPASLQLRSNCPADAQRQPWLQIEEDRPGGGAGAGPRGQRLHIRYAQCGPASLQLRSNCPADAQRQPWFQIKEDKAAAATSVYVILQAIDSLKTILAPILPHTAQKLHEYLGYDGQLFGTQEVVEYQEEARSHRALTYDHRGAVGTWTKSELPPGQALREPAPLFKKLDESVIEEEYVRLGG